MIRNRIFAGILSSIMVFNSMGLTSALADPVENKQSTIESPKIASPTVVRVGQSDVSRGITSVQPIMPLFEPIAPVSTVTPSVSAGVVDTPQVSPIAQALPVQGNNDYVRETQRLLEALKVNNPPSGVSAPVPNVGRAFREKSITLIPGANEIVNMIIGGSTTVSLPGGYDQAVVVVPDVADVIVVSPGKAHIVARAAGATDVVFSDSKTGKIFKAHVIIGIDTTPVQEALNRALPGERIIATAINGSIYLTGTTRSTPTAAAAVAIARKFVSDNEKNVINKITVLGGQQVLLKVQVAEVRRSIIKQFGMNSSLNNRTGSFAIGNAPNNAQYGIYGSNYSPGSAGSTSTTVAGMLNAAGAVAAATNPAGFISTKVLGSAFTSVLNALETEGLVKTLAEPTLVTMSGKTANMLAGGQYPVPAVSQDGRLGTDYRNFGVSLGFTPTVNSPGLIALDLRTEVSELGESVPFPLGNSSINIPVFNTRSANTSVELPSGGTLVIAGLMQNDMQNTISGLPGVKDLPILGKLFSSTSFQKNETELVVTVTAYLVEPIDPNKTTLPTDGILPPTDPDIYLWNRLAGMHTRGAASITPAQRSGFGYITE